MYAPSLLFLAFKHITQFLSLSFLVRKQESENFVTLTAIPPASKRFGAAESP